jgi:hypothetical protein
MSPLTSPLLVTCTCAAVAVLSLTLAAVGPRRTTSSAKRGLIWSMAVLVAAVAAGAAGFAFSTSMLSG